MEYLTDTDYAEATRNGIDKHNVYQRFYVYGWTKEKAITTPLVRSEYIAYRERCEALGLSYSTFKKRVAKGMGMEEALFLPHSHNPKLSQEHLQIAEANGISEGTAKVRVYQYKWPVEKAITEPVKTQFSSRRKK